MDGSGSREGGGAMKPAILRVGVAIILSATGLIFARFVSRKEDNEVTSSSSNPESSSSPGRRNFGEEEEETETLYHEQKQEILSLKSRLEDLQKKEYEMEVRFERYCNLKDQEVMLMEHKNMLSLEKSQLDFFRREVAAMEEEHKKGQDLVLVYLKLVGEIKELRSENGLLEKKANKIRSRTKQLYSVLNKKNRRITIMEKEFLKCLDELETKNNFVKELEDQKANADVLQKEKEEVSRKFTNSNSDVSAEDYRRVLEEYEDLKKDFANGVKEVIRLRWSNACLKHKVMRNGTYGEIVSPNGNLQDLGLEDQADALALTLAHEQHEENHIDHHDVENNHDHHHESSRRKRLMKKLKRWVEGNEKGKSTKLEERCFGRHSLTVEPEEEGMFHSRRSCSSV